MTNKHLTVLCNLDFRTSFDCACGSQASVNTNLPFPVIFIASFPGSPLAHMKNKHGARAEPGNKAI